MNVDDIRTICKKLPKVTEDVKWGADLCFCIGEKMFCVTGLEGAFGVSFKVPDEDFEEVSQRKGFMPAHYVARYKWVTCTDRNAMSKKELEQFVRTSYQLVADKLPKKTRRELGLEK
jgi:predicted DNA-binding protein (MmcQ/YjbR family)